MIMKSENVLVIGASEKTDRYSYRAAIMLKQYGHKPILLGNKKGKVLDLDIVTELSQPFPTIDTITLYVNPTHQKQYYSLILELSPKRIIMNPGTENEELFALAAQKGIEVEEACTLVLLSIGAF